MGYMRFERFERDLRRQSFIHHLKREEELECRLADLMAIAKREKCKCASCKTLRHLADELEAWRRPK